MLRTASAHTVPFISQRFMSQVPRRTRSHVQIRILKPCEGIVEGHSLGLLVPGLMYDLPEGLAQYLVSCKCAEVITVHGAAQPAPIADEESLLDRITKGVKITRPPERRHTTRRKNR